MKFRTPPARSSLPLLLVWLIATSPACAPRKAAPAAPATEESVPELIARADQLYAQRETPDRAREAVALLRRARTADFGNYETVWRLSKVNYYLGAHGPEGQGRAEAFREGIAAGEAAVRSDPNRPEGHFWLGANLGGRAQLQGAVAGLSSVTDIRREMEAVIRLDEGYHGGSAYLVLGQLDLQLPQMLGGDRGRAVENLEKGLRFGERNIMLRLRLAQAYLAVRRTEEARRQLDAIIEAEPDPAYLPEYREARREAERLLAEPPLRPA